jgi:endonuclease/exonuclease/phosphatase family metal-dependent hydrolase
VSTVALYVPRAAFALPLPFVAFALWRYRMRRLLCAQAGSVVVLVFPLMGLVLPWRASRAAAGPTIRVLSLNANSGAAGAGVIVEAVSRYAPDVVLLQETGSGDSLSAALRERYATVTASGQFILATRFPLLRTVEPDKLPYEGQRRSPRFIAYVLDTSLGPLTFYSVHPISPREGLVTLRGAGLSKEVGSGRIFEGSSAHVLEENTGLRELQVRTFAELVAREPGPVVVAGDTNLPDPSPVLRRNLGGLQDAFVETAWGFGYTFPANKWRPWMRIDRILASSALQFTHFEVGRPAVSDHLFVVADVQLAAGAHAP